MNLGTVVMDPVEAAERAEDFKRIVYEERTAEDDAIAQAYRAAARGLPIFRMTEAIARGGAFDNGLPKLAVARADAERCWVRVESSRVTFTDTERAMWQNRGTLVGSHVVNVKTVDWPHCTKWRGGTIVPHIPPRFRPRPARLRHCHLLWEVESWEMIPPVDPALVRHIRGDLWSVLATWDLTELERAVLAQRA